jgi:putative SOS response-associated peptidase YedK
MGLSRRELAECVPGVALPDGIEPRYNIAPTQPVLVLRVVEGRRRGERVRWGMETVVPAGRPRTLINVRAETLLERGQGGRERVLVPATHFFEWRRGRPMLIAPRERLMAFAGLVVDGAALAIVTCSPNRTLAEIHDRMPVVVDRAAWERWLDPRVPLDALGDVLRACPDDALRVTPASISVNDVANDGPAVLRPAAGETVQTELPFS